MDEAIQALAVAVTAEVTKTVREKLAAEQTAPVPAKTITCGAVPAPPEVMQLINSAEANEAELVSAKKSANTPHTCDTQVKPVKQLIEPETDPLWNTSTQKLPSAGKALATLKSGDVLVLLRSGSTLIYNPAAMVNPLRSFTYNLEFNATCVAVCPLTGDIWLGSERKMCRYTIDGQSVASHNCNSMFNSGALAVDTKGNLIVWNSKDGQLYKLKSGCADMRFKYDQKLGVFKMNVKDGLLYVLGYTTTEIYTSRVFVFDTETGEYMGEVMKGSCNLTKMTFSRDGRAVVVSASDRYRDKAIDDVACLRDGTRLILQGDVLTQLV